MTTIPAEPSQVNINAPLTNFSQCHQAMVSQLGQFAQLPALMDPVARARKIAGDTLAFFGHAVCEHHEEEDEPDEDELRPGHVEHGGPTLPCAIVRRWTSSSAWVRTGPSRSGTRGHRASDLEDPIAFIGLEDPRAAEQCQKQGEAETDWGNHVFSFRHNP